MADFRITGDPTSIGCSGSNVGDHVEDISTGLIYIKTGAGATSFTLATMAYGGGGGASLAVEDIDTVPSYSTITALRFDQADGFVLSNPSAGVARVDITGIPQANVTNLTTDLAGKAASSHTHAESDVTSLVTDLAAKVNLAGTAGGQTVNGGTASGENLTLSSTANATKGKIFLGSASAYDQVNDRLGIGTTSPPVYALEIQKTVAANVVGARISNLDTSGAGNLIVSAIGASSSQFQVLSLGSTFVTSPVGSNNLPDSCVIKCNSDNGMTLSVSRTNANAIIRFCTNGVTLPTCLRMTIDNDGNIAFGSAASATTDTNGFFFLGSCAGTPTGVPAGSYSGRTPLIFDSTNGILYAYTSSAWAAIGVVANDSITDAKLRNSGALSVIGRSANSTGDPADISATPASDAVLRESGSTLGFGTIAAGGIASNAVTTAKILDANVTRAKLSDGTALSVIGRAANSGGVTADIATSAASGAVLRESGSTIAFGTVAAAGLASDAVTTIKILDANVTRAKLADGSALSVIGRSANSTGVPADIAASPASGAVFRESGSTIGFGTIVAAGIASDAVTTVKILDANVTLAKMANLTGLSVIGNAGTSSAAPAAITGTASQVLQVNSGGTALAFASPTTDITGLTQATDFKVLTDFVPVYDTSAAANRKFTHYDMLSARNFLNIYEECLGLNNVNGSMSPGFATVGTAASITSEAAHPGTIRLTTVGFAAAIYNNADFSPGLLLGAGKWRFAACIKTPAALSDATNTYEINVGFNDNMTNAGLISGVTNGVWFKYSHSTNSGKWELNHKAAGSGSTRDTGISVTTSTWVTLEFEVNAAATSVQAYVNGTAAGAALTTNIPTAGWDIGVGFKETNGSVSRTVDVDFIQTICEFTTAR